MPPLHNLQRLRFLGVDNPYFCSAARLHVHLALFDISISDIDCRYINTFMKYRYRYRYRQGDFGKYRYRYQYRQGHFGKYRYRYRQEHFRKYRYQYRYR